MPLYNDYNTYLRAKYGTKVYKIGLDAGFTCPNRDGTKGVGGCLYCGEDGSRSPYTDPGNTVGKQLAERINYLELRYGAEKFIAYFQAFSNTYAECEKLKIIYDSVLPFDRVVGISIGTRPDCVDPRKLTLISSYADKREVWIEYGLQSSNDRTLKKINRGHTLSDFAKATELSKKSGIKVCAHVILGLPEETREDIINTAMALASLHVDGVKIHSFHILKGSGAEALYRLRKIRPPEEDEYVDMACDFLENIPRDTIIQRLTGQGSKDSHIAPSWALNKTGVIRKIEDRLRSRGSGQGRCIQKSFIS